MKPSARFDTIDGADPADGARVAIAHAIPAVAAGAQPDDRRPGIVSGDLDEPVHAPPGSAPRPCSASTTRRARPGGAPARIARGGGAQLDACAGGAKTVLGVEDHGGGQIAVRVHQLPGHELLDPESVERGRDPRAREQVVKVGLERVAPHDGLLELLHQGSLGLAQWATNWASSTLCRAEWSSPSAPPRLRAATCWAPLFLNR
jgi:hypothetical protein